MLTSTCRIVDLLAVHVSCLSSPGQVPSKLKQILPFSYKFGFTGPVPSVHEWKKACGACCGKFSSEKSITNGAYSYGVSSGPRISTRSRSSDASHVRTKTPSGREERRILCSLRIRRS